MRVTSKIFRELVQKYLVLSSVDTMRQIKSGSLSLSFTIDGTVYMMKMLKEEGISDDREPYAVNSDMEGSGQASSSTRKDFETFVVELHAANKVVSLFKTLKDGENPEYRMEGPDMDQEEMNQFVRNWKTIVAQEAVGFFENEAEDSLKSTVESFLHLFDHYFGNRIREMIAGEEAQDPMLESPEKEDY